MERQKIGRSVKGKDMNTAARLKCCNRWLGCTVILMLASGIQLEVTAGQYRWSVWGHIVLGILLTALSLRHIYLHYRTGNWFSRFAKNRNTLTRILWWTFLLAATSGIIATIHWMDGYAHSPMGAVHGKVGLLMVLAAIVHAVRHVRKWGLSAGNLPHNVRI